MEPATISSDDKQAEKRHFEEVTGKKMLEHLADAGLRDYEIAELKVILDGRSRDYADTTRRQETFRGTSFRVVVSALREKVLYPELPCELEARSIMGTNFLGMPEVCEALGRGLTEPELLRYKRVLPFSVETLTTCKDTHILVAPQAIDLKTMASHFAKCFAPGEREKIGTKIYEYSDYDWHLVRKQTIKATTQSQLTKRLSLMEGGCEKRPSFVTLLWTMLLWQSTGNRGWLFQNCFARPSRTSGGDEFALGNPTPDGIQTKHCWNNQGYPDVGLAAERRPDNPNSK